jgi:hypothetical protein
MEREVKLYETETQSIPDLRMSSPTSLNYLTFFPAEVYEISRPVEYLH